MNKRILSLALPNIITNITVPLLGIVDMAIVGHLSTEHIGAIAIGTSIFNLIYWNFGFLRMGTSGFTAQAYGAHRPDEEVHILTRAFSLAICIALLLLALQWPLALLARKVFDGSATVMSLAIRYFYIRIWAAPATLGLYAIKGWFIGMQNSKLPMWIAIVLNIVNILCSLLFVLVFHWDIQGVALGTVVAQYSGLAMGLFFLRKRYHRLIRQYFNIRKALRWRELKKFFKVNADIFLRTVCLALVFTFITAESGRISDEILAVDALLLQFFTLFSYIMDGFAYAAESLTGRYIGARDGRNLRRSVRLIFLWGLGLTALFSVLYAAGNEWFLRIFSDDPSIIRASRPYIVWILAVPICGFAAFLFDGVFAGATASRAMRNSMFVATAAFFGLFYLLLFLFPDASRAQHNHILWGAFMLYLLVRGIMQGALLKKSVYAKASAKR